MNVSRPNPTMQQTHSVPDRARQWPAPPTATTRALPEPVRLAIVSTHPIQYYAPVFRALAQSERVIPRVFYTWSQAAEGPVFDPGFGTKFAWDVPLLDGYDHVFVPNVAKRPGSDHFFGIQNPALLHTIADWGADAVLIFGWNLQSHLRALRYFKGKIPVLFRGDSTLLDGQSALRRRLRKLYLRWVYAHVDAAIAVGQNNRDYFAWCGLGEERIAFAPHSIDTIRFGGANEAHTERAAQWRKELAIPSEAITFVFAAKLIPKKHPLLLLDAFTNWRSSDRLRPPVHLVFFGDGELEATLRDRARGHGNIHFLPFQNQQTMPAVYRLGDVYVLPSCGPGETWGLAMNESMASGRPVIASTRVGGARDLVQEGITGWMFESGSAEDLGRVLRTAFATGRDGLRRMGERAKAASTQWSTEAAAQAIATIAHRACSRRSRSEWA
jgi:glycosyltransferase involved in cell wall biosynthesis